MVNAGIALVALAGPAFAGILPNKGHDEVSVDHPSLSYLLHGRPLRYCCNRVTLVQLLTVTSLTGSPGRELS
jgi:hypothetical protein